MTDPQHVTLVANTVSTVTLAQRATKVTVLNVDGAAAVYFTVDGSIPAVAAEGTWVLPAAISAVDVSGITGPGHTVVKLISTGTPKVSVAVASGLGA